jgi:hypothetical protein
MARTISKLVEKHAKKRQKFRLAELPREVESAIDVYMQEGRPNWRGDLLSVTVVWIPLGKLIEMCWECATDGLLADMGTFEEYHKWYTTHTDYDPKDRPGLWPVILCEEKNVPYWGLFEDGWHRFHTYVDRYGKGKWILCIYKFHFRKGKR